jgi:NDP-sugar pyrophosphorylase family protein
MNNEQHQEDTKYLQWADGMYVMLEYLLCDYEKALVENSLRDSVYFNRSDYFLLEEDEDLLGVRFKDAGLWFSVGTSKLTRAQALYIATGDTDI